jgi:hypothetical protein
MIPKISFFINCFAHSSTFATLIVQACSKYEIFSKIFQKVKTDLFSVNLSLNPNSF